jgi:hypothetical protein
LPGVAIAVAADRIGDEFNDKEMGRSADQDFRCWVTLRAFVQVLKDMTAKSIWDNSETISSSVGRTARSTDQLGVIIDFPVRFIHFGTDGRSPVTTFLIRAAGGIVDGKTGS